MNEVNSRLEYLLDRYADKTASITEEAELFSLIEEDRHDDHFKQILLKKFESEKGITELNREKWQAVFDKVWEETGDRKRERAVVYPISKKTRTVQWRSIAAAAVIFIIIGAGLFYFTNKNENKSLAIEKVTPVNDIVPPNSVNAVLTLSNGQKIILDSAGNGMLAQQGAVSVMKLANGQIVYNPQAGNIPHGEIMYNTLSNPAGSKAVNITLADGSRVWLNSESSLHYPTTFTGKERRVEITGEAYFEVAHNAVMPFHVNVKGVDVQVLGTHFNVNGYDEENFIKTTLLEGSVKITKGFVSKVIKPGEQAQIENGDNHSTPKIVVQTVDLSEVTAWKNGRFYFSNTDLETIMRQLARWYNVEVIYKDKISDHYTVNVSREVPVSQLFKFIEMSGGVHFDIVGKKIVVRK